MAVFSGSTALGKKVSVSFPHDKDMLCSVFYDSTHSLPVSTSASLGNFHVTGLTQLVADQAALLSASGQKPKVSLSFQLTSSGLLEPVSAEAVIEEAVKEPKVKPAPAPVANNDTKSEETKAEEIKAEETKADDAKAEAAAAPTEAAASEPEFVWRNKTHRFTLVVTGGLANSDIRPLNASEKEESKLVYAISFCMDAVYVL